MSPVQYAISLTATSSLMRASLCHRINATRFASSGSVLYGAGSSVPAAVCRPFCSGPDQGESFTKKRPRSSISLERGGEQELFFSKYYVNKIGVENYLKRHDISFRKSGKHLVVQECPFCHPTMGRPDNQFKLYILSTTGVYMCHRCGSKGSWTSFRKQVGGVIGGSSPPFLDFGEILRDGQAAANIPELEDDPIHRKPCPARASLKEYKENLEVKYSYVKDMLLAERGLRADVLAKYGVGLGYFDFRDSDTNNYSKHLCYMFPMFSSRRKLMRYKVRSIQKKSAMKLEPRGGDWGLFGFDTLPTGTDEVVLTEGEFDALAVHQATGRPAISLPNGASSLPVSVIKGLERFKKIYLWMDDDIPGQEGAHQFSNKLGRRRCLSVRTEGKAKDANDALIKGLDLEAFIRSAKAVPHEGVATFRDLRAEIYNEIMNPLQIQGTQSVMLPGINNVLKGHRRGELSIFSGHTGVGKTTLLSQMSLDYCMQGAPTLWGSFELANVRLAKLLLRQFFSFKTGKCATYLAQKAVFDEWAERFEELPMFFMRYYGSNPIERIIDAMEYGNYVHDISHVLLDNLQFMTSGQGNGRSSYDRFEVMDNAIQKLRLFATEHNVHVSVVVHPRKESDDSEIKTASIFGSAKATQEADNVIILQRGRAGRMLEIRKNRFDGSLGSLNLRFNRDLFLFHQNKTESAAKSPVQERTGTISIATDDKLADHKLFDSVRARVSRF